MKSSQNNVRGLITQIKTLETHDGPGIRTTLFVKGCPLRCRWCSNPETQQRHAELYFIAPRCKECRACIEVCPEDAITMNKDQKIDQKRCNLCMRCVEACLYGSLEKVGTEVTPAEMAEKIEADKPFYIRSGGGVTISGGEPLFQPEFTSELLRLVHGKGIHTCLDTCGYGEPKDVKQVLENVDLVLLDIKQMDPKKHRRWTGVSNELILKNAESMADKCEVRISIPLIPGVNDDDENIEETIKFGKSLGIKFIDIMPLHKLGATKYQFLGLVSPYPSFEKILDERLDEIIQMIESRGLKTSKERSM